MDQIKIGRLIAELRKEQKMTQLNLANKLGVTDRAVSKWENGRGMPDLSLIEPLCDILDISISELLNGERIAKNETLLVAEQTMISILSDREHETEKRKHMTRLCAVLALVTFFAVATFGIRFSLMIGASLSGEGYSFSAAAATVKAEKAVKYIVDGNCEKAAKFIGFQGDDRTAEEKNWCENMQKLETEIDIEYIQVSKMIEDDYFVSGNFVMLIYDHKSETKYVYDIMTCLQNGGLVFAGIYVSPFNEDDRRLEIANLIESHMSTYNPG